MRVTPADRARFDKIFEEILQEHLVNGRVVERLRLPA